MKKLLLLLPLLLLLLPSRAGAQATTGSITAQGSDCNSTNCVLATVSQDNGGILISITGNASGNTLQFEGGDANGNWFALAVTPSSGGATVTSTTSNNVAYQGDPSGYTAVRVRCSTFVSGTTKVTVSTSRAAALANGVVGAAGTVTNVATTAPLGGGPITSAGTLTCTTCVTSAAALTSTAIMTGGGSQAAQTPSATSTLSPGGAMSLASTLTSTGVTLTGSAPAIIASGTTPYINATGPLIQHQQCSFSLTTSTLTTALSPVQLCTITLPNAAVVWRVNCVGGWSVTAGTTPTFAVGNNWAQTPSGVAADANIGTTNAGVAVEGFTSATTNSNIVATGTLTTSATVFPVTWWTTFTGSATSGAYHPTASVTGTSATGTLNGFCTIL